jgi:ABC-type multidrug transport system fused ATPase/permease subunit
MDEATSNVDILTESKIQHLIKSKFKHSTVLVIAHRLNTIIDSDRVLVLSFGTLVEFDTPANLMAKKEGEFAKLVEELKQEQAT